jgi:hypothetical protein
MANLLGNTTIGGHQAIHAGNVSSYATGITQAFADGRYLILSGGTLTGQLNVPATSSGGDHGLKVGAVRGSSFGSQSGDYIMLYERVHIGYPSGWGASLASAPSYGLGVWGNIHVSQSGGTGGGIILADDGDIVDMNDGYAAMRFSYGTRIYSANRGGSPVITLGSNGVVTANASVNAPIFYDSNDTNYYIDPNSTSVVLNINSYGYVGANTSQTRDKLRVWNSSEYAIGMKFGYGFGHLGDYAMSFQMNNNSDRGFWWGDTAHSDNQGAASLTTDGRMTIATSLSVGEGESMTTPSSTTLYVKGSTSGSEVFAVDGVNGRLFTVTDDLSDSLFSVNTIAGLPVIEAFADNTVKIGKFGSPTTFNSNGSVSFPINGINMPYYNGGTMWFRTATHWEGISGIDVIGGAGEFRISSDSGSISLRVDGNLISSGDVYLGTRGVNLSDWLNQSVSTFASPTFGQVYNNGWFRNNSNNTGLYHEGSTMHLSSGQNGYFDISSTTTISAIRFYTGSHLGALRGHIYANNANEIGFLNNSGGWTLRTTSDKNAIVHGQTLTINGDNAAWSSIYMNDGDQGMRELHCNSERIGFLTQAGGWGSWCEDNGAWSSISSMYSPIYYDYNDSNYYVDPSGTSILNTIRVNNHISQGNNQALPLVKWAASGNSTGMVVIKLPGNTNNYGMVHMQINMYEYNSNNVSTIIIGGHNWASRWYSYGAKTLGNPNKQIRLGFRDGQYCVVIGDASSSWSYGSVSLVSIHNADFYNNVMNLSGSYDISQVQNEAFDWISENLNGNADVPTADYANTAGSLSSMNISQFTNNSGYITGISFANVSSKPTTISGYGITDAITTSNIGSQSVNYAASAGSVAWTNVSSRPTALSQFTNDLGNYGGWLTTSGKAADSEAVDGIDSSRIVYGDGARASTNSGDMNDPNQKSGFYFASNPGGRPYDEWWNWITIAGNSWQSSNNYQFQLAHDFHNDAFYVRRMTNGSVASWREVITAGNIGSQSVNYATTAGRAYPRRSDGGDLNFYWAGQSGQPTWLWGGTDGVNMYVYNPSNFSVNYATTAGSLSSMNISQFTNNSGYITGISFANVSSKPTTISGYGITDAITTSNIGSQSVNYAATAGSAGSISVGGTGDFNLVYATIADNDFFRIRVGGSSNAGYVELATADDASEPIYVRQYTGVFSSLIRTATLLDGSGNTNFPGTVYAAGYRGNANVGGTGEAAWFPAGLYSGGTQWFYGTMYRNGSDTYHNSGNLYEVGRLQLNNGFAISQGGADYGSFNSWVFLNGHYGFYSDINSAHIYPNNGSYGSWKIEGSRGGFAGFEFTATNGNVSLMVNAAGNQTGFHNNSYGWQFFWQSGNLFVYKNAHGGGTQATVLDSSNYTGMAIARGGDTVSGIIYYLTNNGGKLGVTDSARLQAYSTNNNSAFMSFHKAGHYAINMGLDDDNVFRIGGWSAPANLFQMDMVGNLTMKGDVIAFSDERVKKDIQTLEGALDKTLKLRGVSYKRKDSDDDATKIGVIAQEILEVVPEVVSQDADGTYGVAYGNIVGLLIEAIKEQQAQINELKKRLDE